MVSETFELENEKEQTLSGIIETEHPRKKQPAIIFLNGFLDTMEMPAKQKLAAAFREAGYVTVRFDYTYGFGKGSGDVSFFTLSNQKADILRVLDYVSRRGYVDSERIATIGHCFGSMAGILTAAFEPRIKALIGLSTPYWFTDTGVTRVDERDLFRFRLKRYFHLEHPEVRIDYTFFEDGQQQDMARAVRNLQQPLLLVHGLKDESIPPANSEEIAQRAQGKMRLELVESMAHEPSWNDLKKLQPLFLEFLQDAL